MNEKQHANSREGEYKTENKDQQYQIDIRTSKFKKKPNLPQSLPP